MTSAVSTVTPVRARNMYQRKKEKGRKEEEEGEQNWSAGQATTQTNAPRNLTGIHVTHHTEEQGPQYNPRNMEGLQYIKQVLPCSLLLHFAHKCQAGTRPRKAYLLSGLDGPFTSPHRVSQALCCVDDIIPHPAGSFFKIPHPGMSQTENE